MHAKNLPVTASDAMVARWKVVHFSGARIPAAPRRYRLSFLLPHSGGHGAKLSIGRDCANVMCLSR